MKIESKYLEGMTRASKHFKLMGNKLLIERIELGEAKTKGGLLIVDAPGMRKDLKLQKPELGIVIATGPGYYNADTQSYEPLDIKPGNVVMLNALAAQYYSVVPGLDNYSGNSIGLTAEDAIQMRFETIEEFNEYTRALQEG